ncbi:hypothetical protein MMC30_008917 [Trapelia coarctata]|nr:hypothetical protein [Trapelia coarctata]
MHLPLLPFLLSLTLLLPTHATTHDYAGVPATGKAKALSIPFHCAIKPRTRSADCKPDDCSAGGGQCWPNSHGQCRPHVLKENHALPQFWTTRGAPVACLECRCVKVAEEVHDFLRR